jgi:hypothetical protein
MTIENDIVIHQVFLDRVARSFKNDYMVFIKRIVNKLKNLPAAGRTVQLAMLDQELDLLLTSANASALNNLKDLSKREAVFTKRLFKKHLDRDQQGSNNLLM